MGTATVRPSFFFYNAHAEIDVLLKAVRRIAEGGINAGWPSPFAQVIALRAVSATIISG